MANCEIFLNNIDASCNALNKMGGARKKLYYVPTEDIDSVTFDPVDKHITAITLKADKKLYYIEGKKFRNNSTYELQVNENGPRLILQTVNVRAFYETQLEREAVENVMKLDAVTVILPLNDGTVDMFGYSKDQDSIGLSVTAGGGGSGTAMGDDTSIGITFSGPEHNLPIQVLIGADFADTIAALDALVTPPTP